MKPKCWDDIVEPPMIKLSVDGKNVFLNAFTQQTFTTININYLMLLKLPDGVEGESDIESFKIIFCVLSNTVNSNHIARVFVNEQELKLKDFIQELIRNVNHGIIKSLQKIPENYEEILITFQRADWNFKTIKYQD